MIDEITPTTPTPQTEAPQEPISSPEQAVPAGTAQIPLNEPLGSEPVSEANPEPEEMPEVEPVEEPAPTSSPQEQSAPVVIPPIVNKSPIRELLNNARFAIQTRKKKKMEKIMKLFEKKSHITNDEVEKLLHISDATATRYLTILKKENKIKQIGKTGKSVSYSKL